MSPEQIREHDLKCLASRVLDALGVNGCGDAAHIMKASIAQSCTELIAVEQVLEHDPNSMLVYIVMGIRQRLELAAEGAEMLASLTGSEAASG